MTRLVQARLDEETEAIIEDLKKRNGWTDSQVVRDGIRSLEKLTNKARMRNTAGLGEFDSGLSDLGFSKQKLQGFGQ